MGEIADAMLSGLFCATCGELVDCDEPGYPRQCAGCESLVPLPPAGPTQAERKREQKRRRNKKNKERRRRRFAEKQKAMR